MSLNATIPILLCVNKSRTHLCVERSPISELRSSLIRDGHSDNVTTSAAQQHNLSLESVQKAENVQLGSPGGDGMRCENNLREQAGRTLTLRRLGHIIKAMDNLGIYVIANVFMVLQTCSWSCKSTTHLHVIRVRCAWFLSKINYKESMFYKAIPHLCPHILSTMTRQVNCRTTTKFTRRDNAIHLQNCGVCTIVNY